MFSDILIIPYGLNQKVKFKKNFGPELCPLNLEKIYKVIKDNKKMFSFNSGFISKIRKNKKIQKNKKGKKNNSYKCNW